MIEVQNGHPDIALVNPEVLLVIPCFRESGRVGSYLEELCPLLDEAGGIRLLLVEDGGGSVEAQKLDELLVVIRKRHSSVLPVHHVAHNIGKGGAVYEGWAHAGKAGWVAFVDADGSCPAEEVIRMVTLARTEENPRRAYFASRISAPEKKVTRLWHRRIMGRIFAMLTALLLHVRVRDTQCGLKLVPRLAFEKIRKYLAVNTYAFDVDLLVLLLDHGTEVIEVPIDWHEVGGGKIHLLSDSARMFLDLLLIKRRRAMRKNSPP